MSGHEQPDRADKPRETIQSVSLIHTYTVKISPLTIFIIPVKQFYPIILLCVGEKTEGINEKEIDTESKN